jgi:hypothetical protein
MTISIATVEASLFQEHEGKCFQMSDDQGFCEQVLLKRCRENPQHGVPGAKRVPFSLEFEAIEEGVPHFHVGDFSFSHPDIGVLGPVSAGRILNPASPNLALFHVVFG